jgi:hypothetical protein
MHATVSDPNKEKKKEVNAADLLDDIFAEEQEAAGTSAALADLEQLTAVEVAAETEAVVQELRMRQGE